MKRQSLWTAVVLLGTGVTAVTADEGPHIAWLDGEDTPELALPSPSDKEEVDEPPAAPLPPALPATSVPYHSFRSVAFPAAGNAYDAGIAVCCEREYSPLDGIWGGYCREKACHNPTHTLFDALHVKRFGSWDCCPAPAPACPVTAPPCTACDAAPRGFGLPKIQFPRLLGKLPRNVAPCHDDCHDSYSAPHRVWLKRLPNVHCDSCEATNDATPFEELGQPEPAELPDVIEAPVPPSLEEVSPPSDAPPELPPAELPDEKEQGWLPLPRFRPASH